MPPLQWRLCSMIVGRFALVYVYLQRFVVYFRIRHYRIIAPIQILTTHNVPFFGYVWESQTYLILYIFLLIVLWIVTNTITTNSNSIIPKVFFYIVIKNYSVLLFLLIYILYLRHLSTSSAVCVLRISAYKN